MNKNKKLSITFLFLAGLIVLSLSLSWLNPIIKTISFAFLSIMLFIMAFYSFKLRNKNKEKKNHSDIDSMLGSSDKNSLDTKEKTTFWERSEVFGNGLMPFALAFFAVVAFCVFIIMIVQMI